MSNIRNRQYARSSYSFLRVHGVDFGARALPDPEAEAAEISAARSGCAKSRNLILTRFAAMACSVTARYARRSGSIDANDVFQECMLGVHEAIDTFDPSMNTRFSSHLMRYFRKYASRFSGWQQMELYVPYNNVTPMLQLTSSVLSASIKEDDTTPDDVQETQAVRDVDVCIPFSLDDCATESFDVPDTSSDYVLAIDRSKITAALDSFLSRRLPREQTVFRLYYGVPDGEGLTLSDVAKHVKLSRERVRQILGTVVGALRTDARKHLDAAELCSYLPKSKPGKISCQLAQPSPDASTIGDNS